MIPRPDINYQWLIWGVGRVPKGDLAPEALARIEADRRRAHLFRVVTRTIPIVWVEDRSVSARFVGCPNKLRDVWRRWSELEFSGHRIYLETMHGNGSGPGFGFTDVRIYLDGAIVGRAWGGGCSLGFGGGEGPAVAMLRDDLALRVDRNRENLELVRETEPLAKVGGAGERRAIVHVPKKRPSRDEFEDHDPR